MSRAERQKLDCTLYLDSGLVWELGQDVFVEGDKGKLLVHDELLLFLYG
jgi:hypothetical protein